MLQVIPEADVGRLPYDIFDVTKVVPHADYPLRKLGNLTLDRNVSNDFAENEQVAFAGEGRGRADWRPPGPARHPRALPGLAYHGALTVVKYDVPVGGCHAGWHDNIW